VLVVEQVHVERCKQRRSEVDSSSLPPYPRTLKWTSVHFCGVDGFITIRVSPWALLEAQTVMYRWFNDYGYEADIAALREEHQGLVFFDQYLRANGWETAEASPRG
jgi:hypothetical protein